MCVSVLTLTLNMCSGFDFYAKNVFWFWTSQHQKCVLVWTLILKGMSGFDLNSNSNTFWFGLRVELPGNVQ